MIFYEKLIKENFNKTEFYIEIVFDDFHDSHFYEINIIF